MPYSAEERAARRREQAKNRRNKKRAYLHKVKLEMGCGVCGYNAHPAALHFDHIDPSEKKFGIADLHAGWDDMITEIDKCRVLCANCHSIHSYVNEHHLS